MALVTSRTSLSQGADLPVSDLLQQRINRPAEDLPDIPIRYRMAKKRAKLLELVMDLFVRCEANGIPPSAKRLSA